jgi:hypothetical protein
MRLTIARLVFALALLGAPALALAAIDACPPCCDHASAQPCEMPCDEEALQEIACCDAPEASNTAPAKRGVEVSGAAPAALARPMPGASRPASTPLAGTWWLRPARLSVVRQL